MALWSINEKLSGREGADLEQPSAHWQGEALMAAIAEGEDIDEALNKSKADFDA